MKKKLFLLTIVSLFLSSCTKVIELELESSEPKVVVESLISDANEPFQVKLTLLFPYFDTSNPGITNASVFITDDQGTTDTLYHTTNGIYQTIGNRQTVQGRTYTLLVNHDGKTYNAVSKVPDYKMLLDSITYIYNQASTFIEEGYNVILNGQDNGATIDYYRFKFWKNDTLQTDPFKYFVTDDSNVQGNYIVAQVPYTYQPGDTARVEIQSIEKGYHDYLNSVSNQQSSSGGPFDPPPSNPPTNISNGGLGYFAAISRDWKEIILP